MKTKRLTTWACAFCMAVSGYGQIEWHAFPGGNTINGTEYLGANASSTVPLLLKTVANQPIDFSTADQFRARINEKISYASLNSFLNIDASGFMLVTPDDGFLGQVPKGPFSRLHLAEGGPTGNAQQWGYRPWQRNGITFTSNHDQGYMGQKYGEEDQTDMVIQWSDNPGFSKADRLRMIFTSMYQQGAGTGMNSLEGLEGMRLWPKNDKEINVGVGDFHAGGDDPTERLDVRTGRLRIRQLPTDPEANTLDQYMVVDNTGVVKWRHLPVVPPAPSCDWTLNPATHNNVSTAFGPFNPNCPDDGDAVGIGVDLGGAVASAKLNVGSASAPVTTIPVGVKINVSKPVANPNGAALFGQQVVVNVPNYADAWGLTTDVTGHGYRSRGVQAITRGTAYVSWAGDFIADANASYSVGVHGASTSGTHHSVGVHGVSSADAQGNYGTVGEVQGDSGRIHVALYGRQWNAGPSWINPPNGNYGLFATTEEQNDTGTDWAGWFRGNVNVTGLGYIPGGTWTSSDENLKENVEDISNGLSVISQLNPKSYDYLVDAFPQVGLPAGQQYGFIAQELEQVIPQAVKDITFQAMVDSTGQEIHPALPTKIVNTELLIPFLVAAVKEQQATIAQLQDQIVQCCAANQGMAPQGNASERRGEEGSDLREQRLLIIPNPVADLTTLEYYVPQAGKVSLSVSSSDGKPLGTLREEQDEAGAYSYPWNTTALAAGTYFCTYTLDGQVVVKRAVKVSR